MSVVYDVEKPSTCMQIRSDFSIFIFIFFDSHGKIEYRQAAIEQNLEKADKKEIESNICVSELNYFVEMLWALKSMGSIESNASRKNKTAHRRRQTKLDSNSHGYMNVKNHVTYKHTKCITSSLYFYAPFTHIHTTATATAQHFIHKVAVCVYDVYIHFYCRYSARN